MKLNVYVGKPKAPMIDAFMNFIVLRGFPYL